MNRLHELAERALVTSSARLSERALLWVVVTIYLGGAVLLPLAIWLRFPQPVSALAMASMNFLFVSLAFAILMSWMGTRLQARDRRLLVEWTTNLRLLNAEEFEWFVGEVFRREGWHVRETGRQDAADGGIDLELTQGGVRQIVQCKRWTSWQVRVDDIRRFGGTLAREGVPLTSGIFVTLSDFTSGARSEASQMGVALMDRADLNRRADAVRRSEPCPTCRRPMVLDYSVRGWWLRCVASACPGKRDLSGSAGRATQLLLEAPDRR